MASIIGVETLQHPNGTSAATIDSSGNVKFNNRYPKVAIINDTRSASTDGGDFTNGAWRTRVLNTEVSDSDSIVTVANNAFTLGVGTYIIDWSCPAYAVDRHQSKLYNKTDDSDVEIGSSEYAGATYGDSNRSLGSAVVTITSSTSYEIQHRSQTTRASNGMGVNSNFGENSIYAIVKITKIA
jgi:hypothetical protein